LRCLGELKAQLSWLQMEDNLRLDTVDTQITCISDMCNMMSATLKKALCDVCPSYVQEKKLIGKYFEETSLDIALFAKLQEQLKAMQRTLEGEENYCYSGIQASAPRDLIVQQCLSMEDNNFQAWSNGEIVAILQALIRRMGSSETFTSRQ
jgi:hypothetical protein